MRKRVAARGARALSWWSPRWRYPLVGVLLALAAPLGLLAFRAALAGEAPSFDWLAREWATNQSVYLYLLLTTPLLLGVTGWLVGRRQHLLAVDSVSDPLTDLPNRRYFEARLAEEIARARRQDGALALLMIDLDRLKEINDTGGHDAGDRALCAVATALRDSVRRTDVAARYAGDEFVVLAPHTKADAALGAAARIRERLRVLAPDRTVSIGIADLEAMEHDEPTALLEAADHALYRAKRGGRDGVAVAPAVERTSPRMTGPALRRAASDRPPGAVDDDDQDDSGEQLRPPLPGDDERGSNGNGGSRSSAA